MNEELLVDRHKSYLDLEVARADSNTPKQNLARILAKTATIESCVVYNLLEESKFDEALTVTEKAMKLLEEAKLLIDEQIKLLKKQNETEKKTTN